MCGALRAPREPGQSAPGMHKMQMNRRRLANVKGILAVVAFASAVAARPCVAQPGPEASAAYDKYVASVEAQIRQDEGSAATFLSKTMRAEEQRGQGHVVIEKRGSTPIEVHGGMIHDWEGAVFIPGATMSQVLGVVQDYDNLARHYSPQVVRSRLLARHGDEFQIALRLQQHEAITVTLDTDYDVRYGRLDAEHQYSWSRSTRVSEIADAGEPTEHPLEAGSDHGFLWRLNTYWRFVEAGDGVFIECEGISLTRDVPMGLGWLVGRFVEEVPRESLEFTLTATRDAVKAATK